MLEKASANHEVMTDHVAKFLVMNDCLSGLSEHGQRYAIGAAVSYIVDILRIACLQEKRYEYVIRDVEERLGKSKRSPWSMVVGMDTSAEPASHRATQTCAQELAVLPPFMDVATQARRIQLAYEAMGTEKSSLCHTHIVSEGSACMHTHGPYILSLLQRCAYGEVRSKVLLTIGMMLPPELVDEVLQLALLAEGLPVEPQIYGQRQYLADKPGRSTVCSVMRIYRRWYWGSKTNRDNCTCPKCQVRDRDK